jgi:hypothetical protein
MARFCLAGVVVLGSSVAAGSGRADAPPVTVSPELRLGFQGLGLGSQPFPALGFCLPFSIEGGFSAGLDYELLRAYDGYLLLGGDVAAGPIVVGGLRAGLWWESRDTPGGFLRVGMLAGVAAPWLTVLAIHDNDAGGVVGELALDGSLGWAWTRTRLSLNLTPVVSTGAFHSSGFGYSDSQQVRAVAVDVTLSVIWRR